MLSITTVVRTPELAFSREHTEGDHALLDGWLPTTTREGRMRGKFVMYLLEVYLTTLSAAKIIRRRLTVLLNNEL